MVNHDRNPLSVIMELGMGSTPAPGVSSRHPRRVASLRGKPPSDEPVAAARTVTGGRTSHDARGGRAPLHLQLVAAHSASRMKLVPLMSQSWTYRGDTMGPPRDREGTASGPPSEHPVKMGVESEIRHSSPAPVPRDRPVSRHSAAPQQGTNQGSRVGAVP